MIFSHLPHKKLLENVNNPWDLILALNSFLESFFLGKGLFIIGRITGFVGHAYEEVTHEKPVRRISEEEVEYDGPKPRKLP